MSDSGPPLIWTWRLLLARLRRVARPALVAIVLWLAWALAALALRDEEQGPFITLLLLGLCVLISAALAGLGWYLVTRRLRARDAAELAQLIWLNQAMQPRRPLPPLGTWAASPDLLVALWRNIREKRPTRVLELGSGLSTIVMARALELNQEGGELVALEDHPLFADQVRRQLEEHGLEDRARVLDAPLQRQQIAGWRGQWYTLPALDGFGDVDLLLVDGPGTRDRAMALPALHGLLAATAAVVVDDYDWKDTRRMLERWQQAFPGQLRQTEVGGTKWALLRWQRPAGHAAAARADAPSTGA